LPRLKDLLAAWGVGAWQLGLGLFMGNLRNHPEEILDPNDVMDVLEFAWGVDSEGAIRPLVCDSLGYHTRTAETLRQSDPHDETEWLGCPAGRFSLGIRANGNVCGCNALGENGYIEGNIRETSLREIWSRPGAFAWNRNRTREDLTGFCRLCQFADLCLGGCTCVRLTMSGTLTENPYCAHRITMERLFREVEAMTDPKILDARARQARELSLLEVADRCTQRAHALRLGSRGD
jgi:radical SAM protein with 4Fe4S-binding SPASM domain